MSISSLLGTVALVGFLIFLVGAGLAVVAASQNRSGRGGVGLAVVGLIIGILFSIISSGVVIVEPTRVAIVYNTLTGQVQEPLGGGFHVIVPIINQVAAEYDLTQQEYTMTIQPDQGARSGDDAVEAQTKDGQPVKMDITAIYRVIREQAGDLYQAWRGANYVEGFVRPVTRSVVRDIVSTYSAEQLYGEKRSLVSPDIKNALTERYSNAHLELIELVVREIKFSDTFTAAIEQKVIAQQNLERSRTDAERAKTEAQGRADAAVASATGEAQSTEIRAKAQAEALRLVNEQLSQNPMLIQYLYVQNLSDNVQLILLPSNSPFLFDLNSLGATASLTPQQPQQPDATPQPGS